MSYKIQSKVILIKKTKIGYNEEQPSFLYVVSFTVWGFVLLYTYPVELPFSVARGQHLIQFIILNTVKAMLVSVPFYVSEQVVQNKSSLLLKIFWNLLKHYNYLQRILTWKVLLKVIKMPIWKAWVKRSRD